MRKVMLFTIIGVSLVILQFSMTSIQTAAAAEPANPLVGTWKFVATIDSTGKEIELPVDAMGYLAILANGTFFRVGFNENFPVTGTQPATIEDYQAIMKNSWGTIGTYTLDPENKILAGKSLRDLNPSLSSAEFEVGFKVDEKTLMYWFVGDKWSFKNLRVK